MPTISIQEAQLRLSEIIHGLRLGQELVITENDLPVARLVPVNNGTPTKPRQLGTMKGTVLYMAPNFDAPLDDFKDYME